MLPLMMVIWLLTILKLWPHYETTLGYEHTDFALLPDRCCWDPPQSDLVCAVQLKKAQQARGLEVRLYNETILRKLPRDISLISQIGYRLGSYAGNILESAVQERNSHEMSTWSHTVRSSWEMPPSSTTVMRALVSPAWVLVWPPSVRLLAQVTKALCGDEGLVLLSAEKSTSACDNRQATEYRYPSQETFNKKASLQYAFYFTS